MRIDLSTSGLLDPREVRAWTEDQRRAIRAALKRGFTTGGREVADQVRARMRTAFRVQRPGFVNSMRAKVLDRDISRFPALCIGSRISWLGIFETGGTLRGHLLIPLLPARIGPKRFRQVIDRLMRSSNAFFVRANGKVILMAENLGENALELRRFARAERQRTGARRLQRGQDIPIAVLVKSVNLRRRLDLAGTMRAHLGRIVDTLQRELGR